MTSENGIAPSWRIERIGNLAQVKGGKRLPKGEKLLTEPTPFPYIRVCDFNAFSVDLSDIHYLTPAIQEKISRYIITKDDVFISIAGTIGRVGIIPESLDGANLTENAARVVIEVDGSLDKEFLKYCLASPSIQSDIASRRSKNAQPKLALSQIKDIEIPLPPLPEQKKIAHILSTVQRAIEAQERIIQTTTELKKALMHKLFTEGIRNEPQKQTEIGSIPESWELFPIGDLFETQLGKMLSQKAKIGDSPKTYLRNKNVQWGRIDTDDLLRMDFSDREADKFQLRKGDLLVCEGGEVGRAALWNGSIADCYYQKALHRLRPKTDEITNEFMVHWMMFAFLLTNTYGVTGTRTTIAHLPEIKLKPLLVPVPSSDEQAEIVAALDTVDQKHAHHQRKFGVLKDLFRTLLHELMTAKTRVHDLEFSASKLEDAR